MDRRDVLKLGAVASVSGSSCASLLSNPGAVGASDLGGFLSSLDGALASIGGGQFFDGFLPATRSPELSTRAQHGEVLAKKTLRSLLLVGTLSELPPEHLAHEGVQQRLRDSMGEFDDAMFGMTSMLEQLSPTERADLSQALEEDPQLGMRVMSGVDEQAAAFGVSLKQRTKLRALSTHACARLRQSPELLITEYTGKMHKIAARHGARSAAERTLAASIGTTLLWQSQAAEGEATGGSLTPPPPPPQVDPQETRGASASPEPQNAARPERRGPRASHVLLTTGGIALGLTALSVGLGFASGSSGAGLFVFTVGALLGITGLIVLIIGLILLAVGK